MTEEVIDKLMIVEDADQANSMGEIFNVEWQDVDVEVALDSGCCDHVMDAEADAPGYDIQESAGSRRGGGFLVGNGERIPNQGEVQLNLERPCCKDQQKRVRLTFQAARVTRPLMSVSKICSNGFRCEFDNEKALVIDEKGHTHCKFIKRGGLYVCNMRLKAPSHFGRQAA